MKTLLGSSSRIREEIVGFVMDCVFCRFVKGKEEGEKLPGYEEELQFSTVKRLKSRHG